jgi:putative aminopeptidase FrvX
MAKSAKSSTKKQTSKSILTVNSLTFLRNYLNTASPVGFESKGQKIWLEYLRPFIDTDFSDPYGTAVGVINPKNNFKVVIEAHADGAQCNQHTS